MPADGRRSVTDGVLPMPPAVHDDGLLRAHHDRRRELSVPQPRKDDDQPLAPNVWQTAEPLIPKCEQLLERRQLQVAA